MRALLLAALLAASPWDKAADTPDLMQSLPEAGLPWGGEAHCGPVAVSDSLVWLARHGHPALAPADAGTPAGQGRLAFTLGGPRYMRTSRQAGTSPTHILAGLDRYLHDHGCPTAALRYQGDRAGVPAAYKMGVTRPDPAWVARNFAGDGAAWLLIGWYHHDPATDRYEAFAGHWVAVVGYEPDATGRPDPLRPIVHDPAPRSGPATSHDFMQLTRVAHGQRDEDAFAVGAPRYRVGGTLHLKAGADAGLWDGAIVARLDGRFAP